MRYGIFSDVHSNLEAMEATLKAYSGENIDKYVYLGDIVGYGADPEKCIDLLKSINPIIIAGNHDYAVGDKMSIENFNPAAAEAVLWTRTKLTPPYLDYLKNMELIKSFDGATMVHGSLDEPGEFNYIQDIYTAGLTFERLNDRVCFVGHSHIPVVFLAEDSFIRYSFDDLIKIDGDVKYIINVGSAGQPRDGDPRAAYAVYDTDKDEVMIKRINYDIQTQQKKMLKAGLPANLAARLEIGR